MHPTANKAYVPPSREGTKAVTAHVDGDAQRLIRILAAETGNPVDALVQQGLAFMLQEHGKPVPEPIRQRLERHGLSVKPRQPSGVD